MRPERLESFFADPAEPAWSSHALDTAIEEVTDDPAQRLAAALNVVDELISGASNELTETQCEFLRALTLKNFTGSRKPLSAQSLSWLLTRFDRVPTGQRALMIVLLLPPADIGQERLSSIRGLLAGTTGEQWMPANCTA